MSSRQPEANTRGNVRDPSRRTAMRALLILVAITVVAALGTGIYLFTRPTPYAGNWVGPGDVQGTGDPTAIVASLALSQNPLGAISGTGIICAANGGTLARIPVSVEGSLAGSSAHLTLQATGSETSVMPATLAAQGSIAEGQLTLTATSPAHMLLSLQHGSASDFSDACNQLMQPTPTSGG